MSDDENKVVSLAGMREKEKEKTSDKKDDQEPVYCSFCGRPNYMVIKMIQGPGVNICSECTMICVQYLILEDKIPSSEAQKVLQSFWQGSKN